MATSGEGIPEDIRASFERFEQDHIFKWADEGLLSESKLKSFVKQLQQIDPEEVSLIYKSTQQVQKKKKIFSKEHIEPCQDVLRLWNVTGDMVDRWRYQGFYEISRGTVAVIILSGGQGTRLGFNGPKGTMPIGLPSGKSLFALFCERIRRLQELVDNFLPSTDECKAILQGLDLENCGWGSQKSQIPVYIMTSDLNHDAVCAYFKEHSYFGLQKKDVFFFRQGTLPCLTPEGRMILESPGRIATAPDGNGGVYLALQRSGALHDIKVRGVRYLHCFSVDNALCRPADPKFIGYCLERGADCGNKVVWKSNVEEKVGVFATKNDQTCILEYSEIPERLATQVDESGTPLYGAANICNHFFTTAFIEDQVLRKMRFGYHVANKKIPQADWITGQTVTPTTPNGIKLEKFIFDVLAVSRKPVILEVSRGDEFAPVKNATGQDSAEAAAAYLSAQAVRWASQAGARINGQRNNSICPDMPRLSEISPLLSYEGEGLEHLKGKPLQQPFLLQGQQEESRIGCCIF